MSVLKMLKDAAWGLAGVACLLVTLYSVDLGVTAWRKFDEGDGPVYGRHPLYGGYWVTFRSNASGPQLLHNAANISEGEGPRAASYEDATKPQDTASSPYLFQPIRYMNKEKRSVYKEYTDG